MAQPPPAYGKRAIEAGGFVSASDDDGRPRFIWATKRIDARPDSTADAAARQHLARFAPAYGVDRAAVAEDASLDVLATTRTRSGDYLVHLRQKVDGLEVYRGEVKVVMRPDLSLLAMSGTPSQLAGAKPGTSFRLSAGQALSRALSDLYGVAVPEATTSSAKAASAPYSWLDLPSGGSVTLSEPARAKPVLYADGGRLVKAHVLEFYSSNKVSTDSDAYRYIVGADDGRVLQRTNLTHHEAFNYRVFADADAEGRPMDGPTADFTPHPTGFPDGVQPEFILPNLLTVESIKSEPAGVVDPWLDAGAVQTLGNNVDAYADLLAPDGYSNRDRRATTTAPNTFGRTYLTDQEPLSTARQTQASVTNLFYTINWLHDWWYDSGFTEAAANAQDDNFGRGGEDRDAIKGEAQDFGGLNNANMSTPSDGLQPRMQMYLWSPPAETSLTIDPGGLELLTNAAAFGPPEFALSGEVVLGDDGTATPPTGTPTDGCEPLVNDVAGRIVLVDRGLCGFVVKAQQAEAAGAIAVIVANSFPQAVAPRLGNTNPPTVVNIPGLGITLEAGANLKELLAAGPVTASMSAELGVGRDGSLDNMIIAHEWGHYFHHRLQNCGTFQCSGQSEGWGDFLGLHTSLREGDDLDGTYGMGYYADLVLGTHVAYLGIRRFPYSVDFTKNALTFGHIQNAAVLPVQPSAPGGPNSEVHNAGEIWATMLWEAYIELQKNPGGRTFAEVRRAFGDYAVLGLQLSPIDSTYTETRDGILAAAQILNPDDMLPIANAFARRGAGSCAVSPPRDRFDDMAPVTESFEVQPTVALTSAELDDSVVSCDGDGILDAGETGSVTVEVSNPSPVALVGTTVTLSSTTPGISFPDGASVALADVASFGSQSATINIALDAAAAELAVLDLTVTVENATACSTSVVEVRNPYIHADELPESSATEDVEARFPPWSKTGTGAEVIWTRAQLEPGSHAWHGADSGSITDTQLTSPPLQVSAAGDFTISFDHAYAFEADTTFWDGAVIEISTDGGTTWQDISNFVDPGYTGVITDISGNPLGGRNAYTAANASFPASDPVSLSLGTALAGQTVQIRFRIGTDAAVGAPGWTIDNIAFAGIDNTPFTTVVPHAGVCQDPPVADAGADRTVRGGTDVILDASGSSDPEGDELSFLWTQTAGTTVALVNANTANAAFVAPPRMRHDEVLTFQVQVSDESASSTDTVDITVRKRGGGGGGGGGGGHDDGDDDGPGGSDDGYDCSTGSSRSSLPLAMLLGLGLLVLRRRRR